MPRKTKDEAQKTRSAILLAAEKCFYAKGVVSTSLQEIAEAAGVTRGAVYWHFKDKVTLLRVIADTAFLPLEALLERLVTKDLEDPIGEMCKVTTETLKTIMHDTRSRRIFTILTQRCEYVEEMLALVTRNQDCHMRVLNRLTALLEQAREKRKLSSCWTPKSAAVGMKGMFLGFLVSEMELPRPSPARDRAYDEAINSFFLSLRA